MRRNPQQVDPADYKASKLKYDAKMSGGESHVLDIVEKQSKSSNKDVSVWYKKYFYPSDRPIALAEKFYQEVFRLFDPLQPKTRIAFGKQGEVYIFSRAINGFTSFNLLLHKEKDKTNAELKSGEISNLGTICGSYLLTNEIDLKKSNFGKDKNKKTLKIDGDWCGARLRIRARILTDSTWDCMPANAKFHITETVIKRLPQLYTVDHTSYNFGEQMQSNKPHFSTQLFKDIALDPFRKELNINLLKQLITPNKYFKALALRHAETDRDKEIMMTHYVEIANRRLQSFVAALSNQSFRDFVLSAEAEQVVQDYDDYLHKDGKGRFKMAGKAPIWENINDSTFSLDLMLLRSIAAKHVDSAEWWDLVNKTLMTFMLEIPANEYNETPLHHAALCGNIHILRAALDCSQNRDLNAVTTFGDTPLMLAITHNNFAAANELLSRPGIDVTIRNSDGESPLMLAFNKMQHSLCCTIITRYPANYDFSNIEYRVLHSLMSTAIIENKTETISRLLENASIQTSLTFSQADNFISTACNRANIDTIKYLLDFMFQHNLKPDQDIWVRCLQDAVVMGKIAVLEILLNHPCKPELPKDVLNLLLMHAIKSNLLGITKYLIQRGADCNAIPAHTTQCPLLAAAKAGAWPVAEYLAELPGIEINAATPDSKNTCLHLAATVGSLATVQVLLDNNADVTCKNSRGFTAYECAAGRDKKQIQTLLAARVNQKPAPTNALKTAGLHPAPTAAATACQPDMSAIKDKNIK